MENNNYEGAMQSFMDARARPRPFPSEALFVVSLASSSRVYRHISKVLTLGQISGWKFDTLDITVRQRLCEALYSARRTKDAGESLLKLVNTFEKEVYMHRDVVEWISGELSLVHLGTLHSVPSRFHATMSLHSRRQ